MSISIRPAVMQDLPAVLAIYAHARRFMAEHGNPRQWNTAWPPEALVKEDIRTGRLFVAVQGAQIAAAFVYLQGVEIDPTYARIENGAWGRDGEYGVVHRLASGGTVPGVGKACLDWALAHCRYLRIDTHGDNIPMQNLLKKLGFTQRGVIHVQEDNDPRLAYDKIRE